MIYLILIAALFMIVVIIADITQRTSAVQDARIQQLRDFHDALKAGNFPMDADTLDAFEASVRKGIE